MQLSEQIRPWDTLACCWDVKQPTNKCTHRQLRPYSAEELFTHTHTHTTTYAHTHTHTHTHAHTYTHTHMHTLSLIHTHIHTHTTRFVLAIAITNRLMYGTLKSIDSTIANGGDEVCLFVGCLTSQQHASVSQGPVCSDNYTCCHTEIEVADQTFHLTQSQYTDTGSTSPSADPILPGAWQGSHWSANF